MVKKVSFPINLSKTHLLFYLLLLLLPTQLGKYFQLPYTYVSGFYSDYLSPKLYLTDLIILAIAIIQLAQTFIPYKSTNISFSSPHMSLTQTITALYHHIYRPLSVIILSTLLLFTLYLTIPTYQISVALYSLATFAKLALLAYFITQVKSLNNTFIVSILSVTVIYVSNITFAQYYQQSSLNSALYWLGERSFVATTPGIAKTSWCDLAPPLSHLFSYCPLTLRPYATFSHPNSLAGYLLIVILLINYLRGSRPHLLSKIASTLGAAALLFSFSRTAFLAAAYVLLLLLINKYKQLSSTVVKIILYTTLSFSVTIPFLIINITQPTLHSPESFTLRFQNYHQASQLISAHPIIGSGPGQTIPSLSQLPNFYPSPRTLQPIHNVFWQLTTQVGITGLLLSLYLIHIGIKKSTAPSVNLFPSLIVISLLITSATDHYWYTLHQNQLLLAITIGFLIRDSISHNKSSLA